MIKSLVKNMKTVLSAAMVLAIVLGTGVTFALSLERERAAALQFAPQFEAYEDMRGAVPDYELVLKAGTDNPGVLDVMFHLMPGSDPNDPNPYIPPDENLNFHAVLTNNLASPPPNVTRIELTITHESVKPFIMRYFATDGDGYVTAPCPDPDGAGCDCIDPLNCRGPGPGARPHDPNLFRPQTELCPGPGCSDPLCTGPGCTGPGWPGFPCPGAGCPVPGCNALGCLEYVCGDPACSNPGCPNPGCPDPGGPGCIDPGNCPGPGCTLVPCLGDSTACIGPGCPTSGCPDPSCPGASCLDPGCPGCPDPACPGPALCLGPGCVGPACDGPDWLVPPCPGPGCIYFPGICPGTLCPDPLCPGPGGPSGPDCIGIDPSCPDPGGPACICPGCPGLPCPDPGGPGCIGVDPSCPDPGGVACICPGCPGPGCPGPGGPNCPGPGCLGSGCPGPGCPGPGWPAWGCPFLTFADNPAHWEPAPNISARLGLPDAVDYSILTGGLGMTDIIWIGSPWTGGPGGEWVCAFYVALNHPSISFAEHPRVTFRDYSSDPITGEFEFTIDFEHRYAYPDRPTLELPLTIDFHDNFIGLGNAFQNAWLMFRVPPLDARVVTVRAD